MAGGDVNVSYVAGGQIDLIKKINLPESIQPDVNMTSSKGFRLELFADQLTAEVIYTTDKLMYISSVSVSCDRYDDLDYWELQIGSNMICETMYTLDSSDGGATSGFQIFPKATPNTDIKFTFFNDSNIPKRVWITLGFMYKSN